MLQKVLSEILNYFLTKVFNLSSLLMLEDFEKNLRPASEPDFFFCYSLDADAHYVNQ